MNYMDLISWIILMSLFIGLVIMLKDKVYSSKYIFGIKAFLTIIIIVFSMYMYKGKIAILFGLATSVSAVTMFDKNYSDRIIIESLKFIIMQLLIGVAGYYASYNYISLIIISLIIVFVMYIFFTHNGKVSRVKGFLVNYVLLIYFNFPKNQYNEIFQILFVSALLGILCYYFFNREIYFKKNSILNWNFLRDKISVSSIIFEDKDRNKEFRIFLFRHAILSSIAMTGTIFYMKYYGSVESVWLIISLVAMLLPDVELSRKFIIDRIIGTIIGAAVFLILNNFIHNSYLIYISLAIAVFYSVFPMSYHKNALFITYLTLELHAMFTKLTPDYLAKYRIGFTLLGALLVIVIFAIDNSFKYSFNNINRVSINTATNDIEEKNNN